MVARVERRLAEMRSSQTNVRFADLVRVCTHYFGEPRQNKTSHVKFSTPWEGEPYVNIQNSNGQAKPYQVRQIIAAIDKMEKERGYQL